MKLKSIAMATALLGAASLAHADETIYLKAGASYLAPSGKFGTLQTNADTRMDLKNDLGFKSSTQAIGEIGFNLGDSLITVGYVPLNFSGSSTLTRNVTYNGQTYNAGTAVTSEFNANMVDIGYTWYIVNMDDLPSRFQLGIETAVKIISAKTSINGGGVNQSRNVSLPIPTMGLRARVALADFLGVTGRVGYLGYAGNSLLDVDAQVEFSPVPMMGIHAGYRQLNLNIDASMVYANVTFKGPYAGAFIRF